MAIIWYKNYPKQMKRFITLALCIISVFTMSAQNPMFCGFESQFGGVLDWLEAKPRAEIVEKAANQLILVEYNEASYGYHFNRGILYEIQMRRVFASKKEGKEAYDGCMRYFKMISPKGSEFKNGSGKSCQIREAKGKLYDLVLQQVDQEHEFYELMLTAREPRLMPLDKHNAQDARLALDEFLTHEYLLKTMGNLKLNFL